MSLFLPVIEEFNKHNISYVVVGGMATVLHGYTRLTADIDFVILLDTENSSKAISILGNLGFVPRIPVKATDFSDESIRTSWIQDKGLTVFSLYQSNNPLISVDLFVEYPIDPKGLFDNAVTKDLGGLPVKICSLENLIEMKKIAGRAKDIEDIRILEMIKNHE